MSQVYLVFSLPYHGINHLSQDPWHLILIKDCKSRSGHEGCSYWHFSRPSAELDNIQLCIILTHTHLYFCLYARTPVFLYLSVYIRNTVNLDFWFYHHKIHFILQFNLLLQQWKTWLLSILTYFFHSGICKNSVRIVNPYVPRRASQCGKW